MPAHALFDQRSKTTTFFTDHAATSRSGSAATIASLRLSTRIRRHTMTMSKIMSAETCDHLDGRQLVDGERTGSVGRRRVSVQKRTRHHRAVPGRDRLSSTHTVVTASPTANAASVIRLEPVPP